MKTKTFYDLIKTKLSQEQLDEIEKQAQLEVDILKSIQKVTHEKESLTETTLFL